MRHLSYGLAVSVVLLGCASAPHTTVAAARRPAQAADAVRTFATPLYSWTKNPAAINDPQKFLTQEFSWAQKCIAQIAKNPPDPIEHCEGNGLAAGPGVYACDNPFTSHDYGTSVLVMEAVPGKTNLADITGMGPADEIDRSVSGDASLDGILYNFRANDFRARAVSIRGPALIDIAKTRVITAIPAQWKSFREHDAFACNENTSLADILDHWGDQIEFMSFVFDGFHDPDGKQFMDAGGGLNRSGFIAATAADAVALSDDALNKRANALIQKFPAMKDSLNNDTCQETEAMTMRKCLFARLFSSIVGDQGTPNHPTYAWSKDLTIKVLKEINFLTAAELKQLAGKTTLTTLLGGRFPKDPSRLARASEAFRCVKVIHDRVAKNNFQMWTPGGI